MKYGITAGVIPSHLPYAATILRNCIAYGFSPALAYAVAWRETVRGEMNHEWTASTIVSSDGGHGVFQLTSSWPNPGWDNPETNTQYALHHFLIPGMYYFAAKGMRDEALIRCIAAGFNAGDLTVWEDHVTYGDVDIGTANHDYAADVLRQYTSLIAGQDPH